MYLVEQTQYKAVFVVSGCWQGTSKAILYKECEWESLSDRRWFHWLALLYNIRTKRAFATPSVRTARFE